MASLLIFATLTVLLATQTVADVCSEKDQNGLKVVTCVENCVTAKEEYPDLEVSSITLCKTMIDGVECYSIESDNICTGGTDRIHIKNLTVTKPDSKGELQIPTYIHYNTSPPKICFLPPTNACPLKYVSSNELTESPSTPSAATTTASIESVTTDTSTTVSLIGSKRTNQERRTIENKHNEYRETTSPSATDMKKIKYNVTLEGYVQSFLDTTNECSYIHDNFNNHYGENFYNMSFYKNANPTIDYGYTISSWHQESSHYSYDTNRCAEDVTCRHYTQVVWNATDQVGCGVKKCTRGDWTTIAIMCYYSPPGNIVPQGTGWTRRPFTSGPRCQNCSSSHSECQKGLCVKPFDVELQKWYANYMLDKARKEIADLFQLSTNSKDDSELTEWDMVNEATKQDSDKTEDIKSQEPLADTASEKDEIEDRIQAQVDIQVEESKTQTPVIESANKEKNEKTTESDTTRSQIYKDMETFMKIYGNQ